jgi:hypothetical protein
VLDEPRCQRTGDDPPDPGVLRRVRLEQQARRPPRFLLGEVAQPGAGPGAERLVITKRGLNLGEARHRPDPVALQVDDGPGVPQLLVDRIRETEELLIERVDVQHGRLGHRPHLPGRAAVPAMI